MKRYLVLTMFTMMFVGQAQATQAYMDRFNQDMRVDTYNCSICHQSTTGGDVPVTKVFSAAYLTSGIINALNADNDQFLDVYEIRVGGDLNSFGAVEISYGSMVTDGGRSAFVAGNGVTVNSVTILPAPTASLSTGQSVLGGIVVKPILSNAGVITVAYNGRLGGADGSGTVNVYDMSQGGTEITNKTISANGAVTFTVTTATPEIVIASTERQNGLPVDPVIDTPTANTNSTGCITTDYAGLLPTLAMLIIGIFLSSRKKQG